MTRAVVFDFDGVLADTEGIHLAAFRAVFADRGWTLDREQYLDRYCRYSDNRDVVRAFAGDRGLDLRAEDVDALARDKIRRYERLVSGGAVLFPGTAGTIERLGAAYRLAIASGSIQGEVLAILRANQLAASFSVVIGSDNVIRTKPSPDPYLAALDGLALAASNAVAVEDTPWGLTSAAAAGLRTIAVATTLSASELAQADVVVGSLNDITTALVDQLLDLP